MEERRGVETFSFLIFNILYNMKGWTSEVFHVNSTQKNLVLFAPLKKKSKRLLKNTQV